MIKLSKGVYLLSSAVQVITKEDRNDLRIAVDIAPLRSPFTGVGNFELFLLDALLHEEPALAIEGFGRFSWTSVDRGFLRQSAEGGDKMLEGDVRIPVRLRSGPDSETCRLYLWERIRSLSGTQYVLRNFRRLCFEYGTTFDRFKLFHAFNYCPPGPTTIPVIPVVYDLSFLRYPEMHPLFRARGMEQLARYIAAAPKVHTISEFTASEITDLLGVERSKILVTYPGVAPIFRARRDPSEETLRHFSLKDGSYALTVATLEPRKNLRTLISALTFLPSDVQEQMPLCVVGGPGWGQLDLPPQSRALQSTRKLRFLGYASDSQLRDLYFGARIVLYPSLYEGFGMPVIEAMACGAPVAASSTSSLPEAVGGLGRLINPLDVDAWAAELLRAATDDDYRDDRLIAKRRAHALSFTWKRAAKDTIRMYRAIAP